MPGMGSTTEAGRGARGATLPPRALCWEAWQEIRAPSWGRARGPGTGAQDVGHRRGDRSTGRWVDTDLAWHPGQRVKDSWVVLYGVHKGLDLLEGLIGGAPR